MNITTGTKTLPIKLVVRPTGPARKVCPNSMAKK